MHGNSCLSTKSTEWTSPSTAISTTTSGPGRSSRWPSTRKKACAISPAVVAVADWRMLRRSAPGSICTSSAFHYCYAAIHDRTVVFKAYDIDGLLFDTFELTKADDR